MQYVYNKVGKKITLSEQFQNPIEKEAQWTPLTQYTRPLTFFPGLVQALQYKVTGLR